VAIAAAVRMPLAVRRTAKEKLVVRMPVSVDDNIDVFRRDLASLIDAV
jgi:hypothetical protein